MVESNPRDVKKRYTKEYNAKYRKNHKGELNLKGVEYRKSHKDEIKLKKAKDYQKNKDKIKEFNKSHKAERKVKNLERYQKNKNKINNERKTKYRNIKIELIQATRNKCQGDNCNIEYDGTNAALFQFHHINPEDKSFDLSSNNLSNRSWNQVLNEASKCKLLCANCHSLEHTVEKPKSLRTIKNRDIKIKLIEVMGNKCQENNCNIEYDGTNASLFQFHHIDTKSKSFQLSRGNLTTHT